MVFKKSKNLLQPKFLKYFHLFMNDVDFVFRSLSKFSPATAFSISFTTFSMKIIYSILSLSSIFSGAAVDQCLSCIDLCVVRERPGSAERSVACSGSLCSSCWSHWLHTSLSHHHSTTLRHTVTTYKILSVCPGLLHCNGCQEMLSSGIFFSEVSF